MISANILTQIEKETLRVYIKLKRDRNQDEIIVGAQELSENIDVTRPRAYAILLQLENKGVLVNKKRKGFTVSAKGEDLLNDLLHRLKILELFFYQELGMTLENASSEASNLAIHISDEMNTIICEKLGKPNVCPHDIKIPHKINI